MTGHIRQRSAGSFELRYSLGFDPATGKRRVATATIKGSRRDAEKELRRRLHEVDAGAYVEPAKLSVKEWLSVWLGTVKQTSARRTHQRYSEIVERFLMPALGELPLAKLAPIHIQKLHATIPSPASVRFVHTILKISLNQAVEQQLIIRNPCTPLRKQLPRVERSEMVTLTGEQTRTLLAASPKEIYPPILLALAAGLRRNEALALCWRHVDLERGIARIIESVEQIGRVLRIKKPKGEKTRSVTLPSFAVDALRSHKKQQAENLLKLGIRQTATTPICTRADGTAPTPGALTIAFKKLVRSLGPDFPDVHFHSLRHAHATQLLLAGVHPKIAQERLGHSSIKMTLDLYSHVTETMQEDAAAKIDAAFRQNS